MNKPLVSVIIPTYNRSYIVSKAILSVLNQTYTNVQIIVIDDGSTDDTPTILNQFESIQCIRQEHGGQSKARNNGLSYARGTYIASLDSDDIWEPEFLEKCVQKIEVDSLDFVFANWHQQINNFYWKDYFSDFAYTTKFIKREVGPWKSLNNADLRATYITTCPSPSSSLLVRKSSLVSGWNEHLKIGDDWCMLLQIITSKECKAAFTTDCLWHKQIDGTNIYNGRKNYEVIEFLYVYDLEIMIESLKNVLEKKENNRMTYKMVQSMYWLAKFKFTSGNFKESFVLLKKAILIKPLWLPKAGFDYVKKKIKIFWGKRIYKVDRAKIYASQINHNKVLN